MSFKEEIKEAFWPTVISLIFIFLLVFVCSSSTMQKWSHDNCPIHNTQDTCQSSQG